MSTKTLTEFSGSALATASRFVKASQPVAVATEPMAAVPDETALSDCTNTLHLVSALALFALGLSSPGCKSSN